MPEGKRASRKTKLIIATIATMVVVAILAAGLYQKPRLEDQIDALMKESGFTQTYSSLAKSQPVTVLGFTSTIDPSLVFTDYRKSRASETEMNTLFAKCEELVSDGKVAKTEHELGLSFQFKPDGAESVTLSFVRLEVENGDWKNIQASMVSSKPDPPFWQSFKDRLPF